MGKEFFTLPPEKHPDIKPESEKSQFNELKNIMEKLKQFGFNGVIINKIVTPSTPGELSSGQMKDSDIQDLRKFVNQVDKIKKKGFQNEQIYEMYGLTEEKETPQS